MGKRKFQIREALRLGRQVMGNNFSHSLWLASDVGNSEISKVMLDRWWQNSMK